MILTLRACAAWLLLSVVASAAERQIGQPWPDTQYESPLERGVGQPWQTWSNFPSVASEGRSIALRGPSLLARGGPSPLASRSVGCFGPGEGFSAGDQLRPVGLPRSFDGDWTSTNRSPFFDIVGTSIYSFGGYGGYGWGYGSGGWPYGGLSTVMAYGQWNRPWWYYPYMYRPWYGVYGPYYGGGYASFYRPWYLYSGGYSGWGSRWWPGPASGAWGPPPSRLGDAGISGTWGLGLPFYSPQGCSNYGGCYYW